MAKNDRLKALQRIAKSNSLMTLSSIEDIKVVPTIFPAFNRAVGIGGAPLHATWIVHGPPSGGKTTFAAGLIRSFQILGHYAAYMDAEHTVTKPWFESLGVDLDDVLFHRPETFEDMVVKVDDWITGFVAGQKDGDISHDSGLIIVVDTIHKPVCEAEIALLKSKKKDDPELSKGWGRMRANMISTWVDRLTPMVGRHNICFVALAHEHEVPAQNSFSAPSYRVKGGQSLYFEASVRTRITAGEKLFEEIDGEKTLVGKVHHVYVEKNKISFPHQKCDFYVGNGMGSIPLGFDTARELVEEAINCGIVDVEGKTIVFPNGERIFGKKNAYEYVRANDSIRDALCTLVMESNFNDSDDKSTGDDNV